MSGAPLTFNLSSSPSALHDYASLRQVVRSIASRVEFVPRKVPDPKVLVQSEPRLFSAIPPEFLPDVKNPCWYVEAWPNASAGPYGSNLYLRNSRTLHKTFQSLSQAFQSHLLPHGPRRRLRCLPYFYIIGQPKCGTTDLYFALRRHPEVTATTFKEPHWWTRKRFGVIRPNDGFRQRFSVEDYLDLFDLAAFQIQDHLTGRSTGVPDQRSIITGEASASTMWDNNVWAYFYDNVTEAESPLLNLDFIHALQPEARFIVMLRDPVERLYSDYLFFGLANKSAEDFHEKVAESLQLMEGCLQSYSLRSCAYNSTINNGMPVRLHIGLYIVFILDWLSVFQQDQLLVLRLEDHASNRELTLRRISQFLSLGPLSKLQEAKITKSPVLNTRRLADRSLGPMLPVTRRVLTEFYLPFNDKLAKVLDSDAFLWLDRSAPGSP